MASIKNFKLLMLGIFSLVLFVWILTANTSQATGIINDSAFETGLVLELGQQDDLVGSETCKACHEVQFKSIEKTVHGKLDHSSRLMNRTQSCESCHGPGKEHVENGGDKSKIVSFKGRNAKENSASCMQCHSQTSDHATWRGSKHESAGVSCLDCHGVHQAPIEKPNEPLLFANLQTETKLLRKRTEKETCYQCHSDVRKSEFQRSTHLYKNEDREDKISCSSCHDAHGSVTEKLLKGQSLNETCFTCHTEKRGPFLWEHAPSRESCANCHKSHGSNHTSLLKARAPMLCQSCHIQGRHQTVAGKPNSIFMTNRGCLNCHAQVHGSNHPSGINLQR